MQIKEKVKAGTAAPVAIAALLIILYLPVLIWLVRSWINNPYYGHGFLIPIVSGFIFWLRRHNLQVSKPSPAGVAVIAAGLTLYAISFVLGMQFWAALSFLAVSFSIIVCFCGLERAKPFAFPILFLILMIPLPFIKEISYQLQSATTHFASAVAGLCGIPVTTVGNQIELPAASFTVGLPCSGINSLVSLLALAVLLAFLVRAPYWKQGVVILSAAPIAIIANSLRVSSMLLVANAWGADAALGFFHELSSLLFFLLAVGLLIMVVVLLRCKLRTLEELSGSAP